MPSSSLADTADNGLFCGDFFHRKLRNGDFERDLSLLRSLTNWLREAMLSKIHTQTEILLQTSKLKYIRHRIKYIMLDTKTYLYMPTIKHKINIKKNIYKASVMLETAGILT